jgi:molybdate transport system substrate-binding protein
MSRVPFRFLLLGLALVLPLDVTGGAPPPELSFYAAASLRDVLLELQSRCEAASGTRLVFNFGASSDLARQIVAAAKADVFFSADEAWVDHVAAAGLIDATSRRSPLSNRLVVVVPRESSTRIDSASDLTAPDLRRIALADPSAVPAGKYAKAWLERAGLWDRLEGRVVPALDVRAALAAVESGGVDAGIVYRTDAAIAQRARVVHEVPATEGPPISYAIAAIADRPQLERSRAVVEWLAGPAALQVFGRFGFVVTRARADD